MKKNESSRINKKLFTVSAVFAVGFAFLNGLEEISENIFNSSKSILEKNLSQSINKKVELGNFAGLNLLGFSLNNSKIIGNTSIYKSIIPSFKCKSNCQINLKFFCIYI